MRKTAARLIAALLVVGSLAACHSIERGIYAQAPVPLSVLPLREPVTYTVGPNAGQVVQTQHGLLASYFNGADYVQPAYNEYLDHQQVDPNVDFIWDASNTNPVIPSGHGGIDVSEGDPFLPDHWPIWSVVWEGYLDVPANGTYAFRLHVNNGGWLEMKDATGSLSTVISCPGGSGFEGDCDGSKGLSAGRQYIRISYYNNAPSSANAIFSWQPPGAAAFEVVPSGVLFTQLPQQAGNVAPRVLVGTDVTVFLHDGLARDGSFIDPDAGETFSGTVDYGDGTGLQPLDLRSGQTFTLVRKYASFGSYHVVVSITDSGGAAGQAGFQVTVVSKRAMLYVHGTAGAAGTEDFPSLFQPLRARYQRVQAFQYREDRAFSTSGTTCDATRAPRPLPVYSTTVSGFAFDGPGAPVCDSNDDIELNGVLLDADINALAADVDRVTVLANSGGGAIARAYLAYASQTGSRSLDLVDGVVSLEGSQAGSYLAALYSGVETGAQTGLGDRTLKFIADRVAGLLGHDASRPAFADLTPQSPLVAFTYGPGSVPDHVHYVNVAGDITVHVVTQVGFQFREIDAVSVGDLALKPGDDRPEMPATLLPEGGGARFLPSSGGLGRSSTQWVLHNDFLFLIGGDGGLGSMIGETEVLIAQPESHLAFGRKLFSSVPGGITRLCVSTPTGVKTVNAAVLDSIFALDTGAADPSRIGFGSQGTVRCP